MNDKIYMVICLDGSYCRRYEQATARLFTEEEAAKYAWTVAESLEPLVIRAPAVAEMAQALREAEPFLFGEYVLLAERYAGTPYAEDEEIVRRKELWLRSARLNNRVKGVR